MGDCLSSNNNINEEGAKDQREKPAVHKKPKKNKNDMSTWDLPPTTAISIVFQKICKKMIIDKNKTTHCIATLTKHWYYRSVDLLEIDAPLLDELPISITFKKQLEEYIIICKNNIEYTQFTETKAETNDIRKLLHILKSENKSDSAINDINKIEGICGSLFLYNINIFKKYFIKSDFDDLNVPHRLKVILMRKLDINYYSNNNNKQQSQIASGLYPNIDELKNDLDGITHNGKDDKANNIDVIDGKATMDEVCIFLSNILSVDDWNEIKKELNILFDYNYHRLYHLSTISDDLYYKLLTKAPKSLCTELYDIIMKIRSKYKYGSFPFYTYTNTNKKRRLTLPSTPVKTDDEIEIDWIMTTKHAFEILEKDINLNAGELLNDCHVLMSCFYSNIWDWFLIDESIWNTMQNYNKYEIVRIRINDLMNLCKIKYNMNKRPILPQQWLNEYDDDLLISQLLFGKQKKEFSFDGIEYNDFTKTKAKLIEQFMHSNDVKKLEYVSYEQIKNNKEWIKYMNRCQIPLHLRFKISFYCIKGEIVTDDIWLNQYIENYPYYAPQKKQQIISKYHHDDDQKQAFLFYPQERKEDDQVMDHKKDEIKEETLAVDHPIENIYTYTFVRKPFGMELKSKTNDNKNVYVCSVSPNGQASNGNVEIGSKLIRLNAQIIENIGAEQIDAKLENAEMPITITFLKALKIDEYNDTNECQECSKRAKGKVDEQGDFFCKQCWDNLEWEIEE